MLVSRNDPCPCGSGQKYKRCCSIMNSPAGDDVSWSRIRQTENEVINGHLVPFGMKYIPDKASEIAMQDLITHMDFPDDVYNSILQELFVPWFFFNWMPSSDVQEICGGLNQPIALMYLEKRGSRLTPYQRRFITQMCVSHFSFYQIMDIETGKSLLLKDVLLGTECRVKEKKGTQCLGRGDVIFTRVLTLDGQSICIGMLPYTISPEYIPFIMKMRESLESKKGDKLCSADLLRKFEAEIRSGAMLILHEMFNRPAPVMYNTDGDMIEICKVHFDILIPPEQALMRLLPLTLEKNIDSYLKHAVRNNKGDVTEVQLDWSKKGNKAHKDWDNTVLGHITIRKNKLIAEVNSRKRADKVIKLIEKHLKSDAVCKKATFESLEQFAKKKPKTESVIEQDTPEMIEIMKEFMEKHWDQWFDTHIPMLDGQTPREASQTEKGRELLEALLLFYENHDRMRPNRDQALLTPIDKIKKELGLN